MKKVLILVLSSDFPPYSQMIQTSLETWDSVIVDNAETIFYCSQKDNPIGKDTDKVKYFDVNNTIFDMGHKNLAMFEWALANKEFDYIARVNASCYVDKKELVKQIQLLPDVNVFSGVEAQSQNGFTYVWGGMHYIISKDVIQKIVENKDQWDHKYMEDESMSLLIYKLGIPVLKGIRSCSIDKSETGYSCTSYFGKSINFTEFSALKELGHYFYRIKQDGKRDLDAVIMKELSKTLNQ